MQIKSGERFWLKKFSQRLARYLPGEWSQHRVNWIREQVSANRELKFFIKSAGPSPFRGQPGHHIYEFELTPEQALILGLFTLEDGEVRRVSGGPQIFIIPEYLSVTAQDLIPDTSLSESKTQPPGSSYSSTGSEAILEAHEPLEVFSSGIGRFFLFYPQKGLPLLHSIPVKIAGLSGNKMLVRPIDHKQQLLLGNDIFLRFEDPHPFSEGEIAMLVEPLTSGFPN